MAEVAEQVRSILRIYRDRGAAAVAAFAAGRIDEGNLWLRRRTAAFHNLRASESKLSSGSLADLAADTDIQKIWADIRKIDQQLIAATKSAHHTTKQLLQKLQVARQKISCYRSGVPEQPRFEKSA